MCGIIEIQQMMYFSRDLNRGMGEGRKQAVKEIAAGKNNGGGVITGMEGEAGKASDIPVQHKRDPLFRIPPQRKRTERSALQRKKAGQILMRSKAQAGDAELLADIGGAKRLIGKGNIKIVGSLLAVAQENILAEEQIICDKGQGQAVLHAAHGRVG